MKGTRMQQIIYMGAAIAVGLVLSAQPPLNAYLSRALGSPYGASAISIGIAFVCILIMLPLFGSGRLNTQTLTSVPWWVYLAGVSGAIFVASGAMIPPVTGALIFFVCLVAGQLIGSVLADHFGAFGLAVREITIWRILGIALVLAGAIMVGRG